MRGGGGGILRSEFGWVGSVGGVDADGCAMVGISQLWVFGGHRSQWIKGQRYRVVSIPSLTPWRRGVRSRRSQQVVRVEEVRLRTYER